MTISKKPEPNDCKLQELIHQIVECPSNQEQSLQALLDLLGRRQLNHYLPDSDAYSNSHQAMEVEITRERLRQARHSFNLALAMTMVCTVVGLTGAGLLLIGKVSEGVIATAGGMAPILPCVKFARDTNDRLDKILKELQDND